MSVCASHCEVYMYAGLCACVAKGSEQPAMPGVSASTTASTFAAGVAESFMEMSCLPEGISRYLVAASVHMSRFTCLLALLAACQ